MRMRKKKNLLSRMERCAEKLIDNPTAMRGQWHLLMPKAQEIHLELGCGKGRFTAGMAREMPETLFLALEVVPEAIVVAMERCASLPNVYFLCTDANMLPTFFAAGEIDRIYLNFSDPWSSKRHAKRRLSHGNFLKLYRQILKRGGQIHLKTDNQELFAFSLEELPRFGFSLSEITWNLHEFHSVGIMTDYELKFYQQGLPICRLVGTMEEWKEPFPDNIREIKYRWLSTFAANVSQELMKEYVYTQGNIFWHIFSQKLVPCLEGDAAREAFKKYLGQDECYLFYYDTSNLARIQRIENTEQFPPKDIPNSVDWYVIDQNFTWTYAQPHAPHLTPYFRMVGREEI